MQRRGGGVKTQSVIIITLSFSTLNTSPTGHNICCIKDFVNIRKKILKIVYQRNSFNKT